jgi:hypothetical protein
MNDEYVRNGRKPLLIVSRHYLVIRLAELKRITKNLGLEFQTNCLKMNLLA